MLVNVGTAGQLALLINVLSRTWLFMHLLEWLFVWHPCKNGLISQRRMQIEFQRDVAHPKSVRYYFPGPVGLDGYE